MHEAPLVAPELKIHQIKSKFVDQTFEIYVKVPTQLADGRASARLISSLKPLILSSLKHAFTKG